MPADDPVKPDPIRLDLRVPEKGFADADEMLEAFLEWASDRGLELYPHQEEAVLELFADSHVVLDTPTGSGKSLVALGLHFRALCEGRRSFYTAPIKALASEKFFSLCEELGAENVGMLTGDASINWSAPVICCTAEVLANMAIENFVEMRDHTGSPAFIRKKKRERFLARRFPNWYVPLYTMATFTRIPYGEAVRRAARQDAVVQLWLGMPVVLLFIAIVVFGLWWIRRM